MTLIRETEQGLTVNIRVQPRASRNAVVGRHGDAIKVALTAPPVGGAANSLCLKYLSKRLGIPRSSLEIVSGLTGRNKRLLLRDPENGPPRAHRERLKRAIAALLGE